MVNRYRKGQPVVIQRKVGSLLGIVVDVGQSPTRYMVQPARLVGGQPQVIAAALAMPHVRGSQLRAFDPASSVNPWKLT